ncbi:MAG: hypothetical protein GPOALKHO_001237 [Sodalis sp.]|nr:MAG: hypothetical protein GPOALKHO_001237 [Sodalis sp.]
MKTHRKFNATVTVLFVSENITETIPCLPIYPLLPLNDIAVISSVIANYRAKNTELQITLKKLIMSRYIKDMRAMIGLSS